jgi:hypothetical protein
MKFEEIQALIPQYLAGQLTAAEKETLEGELSRNAALRLELEELRSVWQSLGLIDREQPSAAMRARFYQRLNAVANGQSAASETSWRTWKTGVPQLAAALALFALGLLVGRVSPGGTAPGPQIARLRSQVEGLRQTVALSLIDRDSATSRLEGISWGSQVQRPDNELLTALLTTLNRDQNINVRLASLDALEKLAYEPTVRKALEQSIPLQQSPLVQIALIDALVHIRDNAASGEFRKLTADEEVNASVRQRAQWGLRKLNYQ